MQGRSGQILKRMADGYELCTIGETYIRLINPNFRGSRKGFIDVHQSTFSALKTNGFIESAVFRDNPVNKTLFVLTDHGWREAISSFFPRKKSK